MKEVYDSREKSSEFVSEDLSNLTPSNQYLVDGHHVQTRPKKKLKRANPTVKHSM